MAELFIDVLPNESSNLFRVILLNNHSGLRINEISSAELMNRFESVLGWPKETTERLREQLESSGKLTNERLEYPTDEQLKKLGFD